jgi:hypothetical protein
VIELRAAILFESARRVLMMLIMKIKEIELLLSSLLPYVSLLACVL